ncbi:Stp1/IreP family PP2C-type Ser/Thr phosphatase [Sporosarcina gallistercoris]|uniref:Stp1/IreP family PP2C-type Ser/Thr phosphatase n=1 Tax=Sporosarcina gallistercoris TaxID=2762245 RepID=A0ABR8PG89_9BACL|nr:Stp1/IreP family PP2C-type Ser/Thr phosphatase [Sporosarcina gallistercoris]MBD7907178.1 Stp1/IreP family PP2C-type Ser/Thr phosphatase [Sporosarcina gallistercoris]
MHFSVRTDIGRKRTFNEDQAAVFVRDNGYALAVIADGMGGHRSGDVASAMAVRLMGEHFNELNATMPESKESWNAWLDSMIRKVNQLIFEKAQSSPEHEGMGTTLEAAVIAEGNCYIAHVGDSRVYTITSETITQLTKDHSYVNALLASGEITEEEAEVHPQRNWIMRAVGSERDIEPEFYHVPLTKGDYLLLCTDGLSNKVEAEVMREIIVTENTLDDKVIQLIDLANTRGGEDNITAVLLASSDLGAGAV